MYQFTKDHGKVSYQKDTISTLSDSLDLLGKYSHSITINSMRMKHRSIERSCREILSSAKSSNDVRVHQMLGLYSYWYLLLNRMGISLVLVRVSSVDKQTV
jgi:hypothetical protein